MSEEEPQAEPTIEDLRLERAEGYEPIEWTLMPPSMCGHQLLVPVRDDFELHGVKAAFALCVLCGTAMVRWSPSE